METPLEGVGEMTDIVTRLREASSNPRVDHGEHWNLHDEAADEIERLRIGYERYETAIKNKVSDRQVIEWANRYNIDGSLMQLRCALEDGETLTPE